MIAVVDSNDSHSHNDDNGIHGTYRHHDGDISIDSSYCWGMASGHKRVRRQVEDEVALREIKRLRISDATGEPEDKVDPARARAVLAADNPCQALILRPVAPAETTFRLAVSTDYPETFLGRRLLAVQPAEDVPSAVPVEDNKQLVIYQPPLAELIKEAAFLEEHQMHP